MSEYIEAFRKAWYNDQSRERIRYDKSTHAPIWENVWKMFAEWVEKQKGYTISKCDLRRIRVRTGYLNSEPWLFISRDDAIKSAIYVKIVMCSTGIQVGVDFNEKEASDEKATDFYVEVFEKCFSMLNDGWQIEDRKFSIYKSIKYKDKENAPDEDYKSDFNNLLQEAIKQYEIAIEEFHEIESKLRASSDNIGENEGAAEKQGDNTLAHNRIIFGAPGTGKSHTANLDANALLLGSREKKRDLTKEEKETKAARMERVTFHPEYSYYDFVGSYKPVMKNVKVEGKDATERKIEYDFVPGPFMRIFVKALKDKEHPYLLLIEEINRARVAAVFGDIFQLLDRTEEGESEYSICLSEDLKEHLKKQGLPLNELKLPSNLYIWATMNSADQGVYPLDTAFKRRWSMEYLDIDYGKKEDDWNKIRTGINKLLIEKGHVNEDKLMGYHFLKKEEMTDAHLEDSLKGKVLMYLFDDAAKPCRKDIFKEINKARIYSDLRAKLSLSEPNLGIFDGAVFWPDKNTTTSSDQDSAAPKAEEAESVDNQQ